LNKRTGLLFGLLVVVAIAAIRVRTGADLHSSSLIAPPTLPSTIPKPVENHYARIDDQAQILFPFGEKLSRMADSFAADLGVDVHIVTLTARASSIEKQADQVFQTRRIGTDAPTGGVLVVLNPTLGEARIEVGYSLEGTLTDLHMSRLARNQLAPYASYGAAGMAVMDVLHYLRDELYIASALGSLDIPANLREKPEYLKYQKFVSDLASI
jgi:uncharacterized membrane protein YgcG